MAKFFSIDDNNVIHTLDGTVPKHMGDIGRLESAMSGGTQRQRQPKYGETIVEFVNGDAFGNDAVGPSIGVTATDETNKTASLTLRDPDDPDGSIASINRRVAYLKGQLRQYQNEDGTPKLDSETGRDVWLAERTKILQQLAGLDAQRQLQQLLNEQRKQRSAVEMEERARENAAELHALEEKRRLIRSCGHGSGWGSTPDPV